MEVERRGWTSFARVIANWETRRSINFRSRFAVARRQGNGWDEPYKPRGLRTVLWAAGGEIPPADPAFRSSLDSTACIASLATVTPDFLISKETRMAL